MNKRIKCGYVEFCFYYSGAMVGEDHNVWGVRLRWSVVYSRVRGCGCVSYGGVLEFCGG